VSAPAAGRWVLVSKPLREPFRDGSTVLARTLVERLPERFRLTYFGDPARPLRPGAGDEILPARPMPLSPGLWDKARVLRSVADPRRRRLPLHFFFTPNRVSSVVLAALQRLPPRRTVVQDLTSSHGATRFVPLLRSLDAIVVHSEFARRNLAGAGVAAERLSCILPGVASDRPAAEPQRHRRLLYAGDLEQPVIDRLLALRPLLRHGALAEWSLCIASRPKSGADLDLRAQLRLAFAEELAADRVEILGQVEEMGALFRRTALQIFLAEHVARKVDLPLVLLEGLALGVPLIALDVPPVSEIFELGRKHGLCPGLAVAAGEFEGAIVSAARRAGVLAEWGRGARELARREFSAERMVAEYARLYDGLERQQGGGR